MPELARTVWVTDERGRPHRFGPGSPPPEWAAVKIRNPRAWATGGKPAPQQTAPPVPSAASPPPRSGAGSGGAAWRAFAAQHGVDGAGLSRDELMAELVERGVIKEA
ncbi:hypothetical protein UA75_31150 (plasmid) [Actinoalloteichus sp. GBA129-24]|nr:hypothetical protein UA75_14670 [Actinoalloteichus sp. GBA129-24]APU24193.1 hypothetical protein UA75_31150 [Actinoalloteichus sp. GBA129-24]